MNDWRLYALLSFTNPMCACRRWPGHGSYTRVNAPSAGSFARKPDYRFQSGEARRVFFAMSKLGTGDSVTTVALQLGYDSPGAFSTMFRKRLGSKPSNFMAAER
jgi:AraC-like DNA-binding protein